MNTVQELTAQTGRSHFNLFSSSGKAWAERKTTKEGSNIEVMNFDF